MSRPATSRVCLDGRHTSCVGGRTSDTTRCDCWCHEVPAEPGDSADAVYRLAKSWAAAHADEDRRTLAAVAFVAGWATLANLGGSRHGEGDGR